MQAANFQPMLSTVVQSQDSEVNLGRQPVLAEWGREVRTGISALPPEVSRALLAGYQEPDPAFVGQVENAITVRELAIEGAQQEVGIDQDWLAGGGQGRKMNERSLSADDDWNAPGL